MATGPRLAGLQLPGAAVLQLAAPCRAAVAAALDAQGLLELHGAAGAGHGAAANGSLNCEWLIKRALGPSLLGRPRTASAVASWARCARKERATFLASTPRTSDLGRKESDLETPLVMHLQWLAGLFRCCF